MIKKMKCTVLSFLLAGMCFSVPTLAGAQSQTLTSAGVAAGQAGGPQLYEIAPQPLTVQQCGQCHPGVFKMIKNDGGKHQIECASCHLKLHSFTPNKPNWAEIMPQCSQCHTFPHGEAFKDCLTCHTIPHTPTKVPVMERLEGACGTCHTSPNAQLQEFTSKHTEQGCTACHTAHGLIPSCFECHEPHLPAQPLESCKSCHPVHKPLQISYGPEDSPTCAACHEEVHTMWTGTVSKHGQVQCAECHELHGQIPECSKCHDIPHDPNLLKKFPVCLDCHLNVHDLPVKR